MLYNEMFIDEPKVVNRKVAFFLRMRDRELIKEQQYNKKNVCNVCHGIKALNGSCGCN